MLVLSRQKDETIMIGDDIEITIVDVKGDKVRVGISAPLKVPVHRKEVYLAIQRENQEAATTQTLDVARLAELFPPAAAAQHKSAPMAGRLKGTGRPRP